MTPVDISGVPEKKSSEVRLLYHCNYYDGILSGFCLVGGEKLYFNCFAEGTLSPTYGDNEDEEASYAEEYWRRFALYRVHPEDLALEEQCHAAFQKYVGTQTDYNEEGKRILGALSPQYDWQKFYDDPQWKDRAPYRQELVGWFDKK